MLQPAPVQQIVNFNRSQFYYVACVQDCGEDLNLDSVWVYFFIGIFNSTIYFLRFLAPMKLKHLV